MDNVAFGMSVRWWDISKTRQEDVLRMIIG